MKITKSFIKQIIMEEINRLNEVETVDPKKYGLSSDEDIKLFNLYRSRGDINFNDPALKVKPNVASAIQKYQDNIKKGLEKI